MYILPERDIPALMTRAAAFDAVERVFAAMAGGTARNFPVVREALGHADALYGFKGGFDAPGAALGLKAGGYWPHNAERHGLINHQSTVVLFNPDTGRVRAMVGGNHLTALRTAAASAVSIRHLARADARVLGIVGAGHQAGFQLRAALEQRPFEQVVAWNRTPEKMQGLADICAGAGVPFAPVELAGMRAADVIVTMTSSFTPILTGDHVSEGTHIAAMGTDTAGKQELCADLVARAALFTDEVAQSRTLGEAQHAFARGRIAEADITPLGAVINGTMPGRPNAAAITLFDGTGVGLQDLAVAAAAVDLARAGGVGTEIEL